MVCGLTNFREFSFNNNDYYCYCYCGSSSLTQQVQMPNMLKNHILGVWNSSDISLDLGKLQIRYRPRNTLDRILLPLELLMTFSTPLILFLEKNILSNVFSYVTVGAFFGRAFKTLN